VILINGQDVFTITAEELNDGIQNQLFDAVIDVRTQEEWDEGHIPTATFIESLSSLDVSSSFPTMLQEHCNEKNKLIAVYCRSGARAGVAAQKLINAGYKATIYNAGGVNQWLAANFNLVETKSKVPFCSRKCANNVKFRHQDVKKKSCVWIGNKEKRRETLCANQVEVQENCLMTCAQCCVDDEYYTFKTNKGKSKKCSWLNKKRSKKYCKKERIRAYCPVKCEFCKNT